MTPKSVQWPFEPSSRVGQAEHLIDLATGELANGRPAAALRALREALGLNPGSGAAHFNLGVALGALGRYEEAAAAYRTVIEIDPTCTAAHRALGELLDESGDLEEAARCYREVIRRAPTAAAQARLGGALWKLGDSEGALTALEQAVLGDPSSAAAHYNLGCVQLELGHFAAAVDSARAALRLSPAFPQAMTLCAAGLTAIVGPDAAEPFLLSVAASRAAGYMAVAIRLMSSRLFEPARQCLERVVGEAPGHAMALHLLASLARANPEHPVEGYVRELFDASAATFDHELVAKLGYDIPREMAVALQSVARDSSACSAAPPWNVLDLGCGTGLVGEQMAPFSQRLVGVDLAPKMIERAAARDLYTSLYCTDLMTALAQEIAHDVLYDVVTAADVFIYVGKLDEVIEAIRRVLRVGGLFAASVEGLEAGDAGGSADYRLGVMGRYAHAKHYLQRLAAGNSFEVIVLRETRIRLEHRRPVAGWLTVWRAV